MGEKRRPNILLFITDQHRADHLGCYGNKTVRTPNIDSLAMHGTCFDRFYVATPICMPNRASLMTGRMPSLHGVRHNGIPLALETTTFPEILRRAGYATALFGKSHLQSISSRPIEMGLPAKQPDLDDPPGDLIEARQSGIAAENYDQELPERWTPTSDFDLTLPFYGFERAELAIGHGDIMSGHYGRWLAERCDDPNMLSGRENAFPTNTPCPQAWRTRIPEELYPTSFVAERCIDFLQDHACSGNENPFFLQCSFPDPHHPFTPPGRYWDMYDPAEIDLPATFAHPTDRQPPHLAAIHRSRAEGQANPEGHTVFAATAEETRAAIALTYGSITMIDDAIGRVLDKLRSCGLDRDTIVIFTTDHGDFMGDHGLLLKGALHYDGLIRVPCIWTDPREEDRPARTSELCGTIDLAVSILIAAGIQPFNGTQGQCLPLLRTESSGRSAMVIEDNPRRSYMGFPSNFTVRTLVTATHRLTLYSGVEWGELYDLESDPCEFDNLWNNAKSRDRRLELTEQLVQQMMLLSERSPLARGHGP